ncbi:neuramidase [Beutenbergia cavernae DSM 12333]|uniref:exo-alpha-sialidase n=1 Tax=Beutenbergia cavernae (strain ATCC BAA-8 / DSM 12333 / CCUG 43141 / JCM 11478 / NBRC 16432 / NCIMB 13614 / HKI 0122) TaxID=471853 RepID=C5C2K8_BEUC1|nr:sialidase family protein [Beutenbergia cavernae]ACQ79694.1 neuramidase [Beutenbergia cavernae DSM 12333]
MHPPSFGVDAGTGPGATTLFAAGTHGYAGFRIPALLRVGRHVLAFCEGRTTSLSDTGEIRLVLRRSADDGRTWGPLEVVAAEQTRTIGNPVPFATADGAVVLLTTTNGATRSESELKRPGVPAEERRRVWVQRADSPDAPFSAPLEITADVKPDDWGWYATGPSGGVRLTDGPFAGRLVAACAHSRLDAPPGTRAYGTHLVLSDDDGRTWRRGATDSPPRHDGLNPNEATVAPSGGSLYVNARNESEGGGRLGAWSDDGGETFRAPFRRHDDIASPAVQGHVVAREDGDLVLGLPADPGARRDLALRRSSDGGGTWGAPDVVVPGPAAYSSLGVRPDGGLDILVERGESSPYEQIAHLTLPTRGTTP